ncbi:hypothetical protein K1W54_10325 [Micromonospora sp. CPCC 205371]|nr:hypothetical protein [Micromonospora sp. CPCC 205371]
MPAVPSRPESLEWRVFRGSDAVRDGLLSEHQLRNSAWVHLRHDIYADARLKLDHTLLCRAYALRLPAPVVFAGPSAAHLHGVPHAATYTDDVHVIVPPNMRVAHRRGLHSHALALTPEEKTLASGLHATSGPRTAWDCAVWLELGAAVAIVDSLLALRAATRDELTDLATRHLNKPWTSRVRRVFDLSDGLSGSPAESHLRIGLITAGLPRPLVRYPVELASGRVVRPRLSWPRYKLAVEHEPREARDLDMVHRKQRGRLISAGWTVLTVTSPRAHRDFTGVAREVRRVLTSLGWH